MRSRIALLAVGLMLAALMFPVAPALGQDCTTAASLRFLNLSADAGAVDVLVNDQVVLTNVAVSAGSAFVTVPTGTVKVQLNQTGTTTVVVSPVDVTTTAGGRVTITAVTQTPAGGGQQPTKAVVGTQVFQDDIAPPAAGQARIRVISGSPDAGAIDVVAGGTVVVSNLAFPNASAFVDVPAGTQVPVTINATGTTTVLAGPTNLDLVAGRIYTIFVSGTTAGMNLALNLLVDRAFDAQARFIHASPDAPAIDVIADGRAIVSNLAYPNVTQYVAVPAGGTCVAVVPTGATTALVPPALLSFESASKQTAVILGQAAGTPALAVAVFSDATAPPAADKGKIRFINASPDAGGVDVLVDGTAAATNVAFAAASDFIEVAAGERKIVINETGTTTTVQPELTLTVGGGQVYTIILRGKKADNTIGLTIASEVSGG
jgi:hypothetical protein